MKATSSTRPRAPKVPGRSCLMVSASRSAKLRMFASMLNVRPTEFLDWILSDYVKSLGNPTNGLLAEWADESIVYDTPEEAARVKTRVHEWLARKAARQEAAELKGGQKQ